MPAPLLPMAMAAGTGILGLSQPDPTQAYAKAFKSLDSIYGPQALGKKYNAMYMNLRGSPLYSGMLSNLMAQKNLQTQKLNQGLARTGMRGSAVGRVSNTLATSNLASNLSGINMNLYGMGMEGVMNAMGLQSNAAGMTGASMRNSILGSLFNAGAGLMANKVESSDPKNQKKPK